VILLLHDMEELSDADIAEITGLRAGTIRVRLHRARLSVRGLGQDVMLPPGKSKAGNGNSVFPRWPKFLGGDREVWEERP
jgi:Sigma-70, region 4